MFNWIHHLFNPHCVHCAHEQEELRVCTSCENLKEQIAFERAEKQQLLNHIVSLTNRAQEPVREPIDPEKYKELPKAITWRVRKQMLEAEDRNAAALIDQQRRNVESQRIKDDIAKLEKELGIEETSNDETVGRSAEGTVQTG